MAISSKSTWRGLAVAVGVVLGTMMYIWTADTRTLPSYLWSVVGGVGLMYTLSILFVPGGVVRSDRSAEEDNGGSAPRRDGDRDDVTLQGRVIPTSRVPRIAWGAYAVGWLVVLSEAARSVVLTDDWMVPPELYAGVLWAVVVCGGLFCWWTFRRRAIRGTDGPDGRRERLTNLIVSWAGAVGVGIAGVMAEFTGGGGLLVSASLLVAVLCLSVTYPRSSWWGEVDQSRTE